MYLEGREGVPGLYNKRYMRTRSFDNGIYLSVIIWLTLIVLGLVIKTPFSKFKKVPMLHNNNTALIKQISLFDTALVKTNT